MSHYHHSHQKKKRLLNLLDQKRVEIQKKTETEGGKDPEESIDSGEGNNTEENILSEGESSNQESDNTSNGMKSSTIAIIVVCSLVAVLLLAGVVVFIVRRNKYKDYQVEEDKFQISIIYLQC